MSVFLVIMLFSSIPHLQFSFLQIHRNQLLSCVELVLVLPLLSCCFLVPAEKKKRNKKKTYWKQKLFIIYWAIKVEKYVIAEWRVILNMVFANLSFTDTQICLWWKSLYSLSFSIFIIQIFLSELDSIFQNDPHNGWIWLYYNILNK